MTAVRLGLRQIKGLGEQEAQRLLAARLRPYRTLEEIRRRAGLRRATLVTLAEADAFRSLGLDRRQALWAVQALKDQGLPLFDHAMDAARPGSNLPAIEGGDEPWLELPEMGLGEHVIEDYATLRLSLKAHPWRSCATGSPESAPSPPANSGTPTPAAASPSAAWSWSASAPAAPRA